MEIKIKYLILFTFLVLISGCREDDISGENVPNEEGVSLEESESKDEVEEKSKEGDYISGITVEGTYNMVDTIVLGFTIRNDSNRVIPLERVDDDVLFVVEGNEKYEYESERTLLNVGEEINVTFLLDKEEESVSWELLIGKEDGLVYDPMISDGKIDLDKTERFKGYLPEESSVVTDEGREVERDLLEKGEGYVIWFDEDRGTRLWFETESGIKEQYLLREKREVNVETVFPRNEYVLKFPVEEGESWKVGDEKMKVAKIDEKIDVEGERKEAVVVRQKYTQQVSERDVKEVRNDFYWVKGEGIVEIKRSDHLN